MFYTKLDSTTVNANISNIGSNVNTTIAATLVVANILDIETRFYTHFDITTYHTQILGIGTGFDWKLDTTILKKYTITATTRLNNQQGMCYPIVSLWYSANAAPNIMELTLYEHELTTLTHLHNECVVDVGVDDVNKTMTENGVSLNQYIT